MSPSQPSLGDANAMANPETSKKDFTIQIVTIVRRAHTAHILTIRARALLCYVPCKLGVSREAGALAYSQAHIMAWANINILYHNIFI